MKHLIYILFPLSLFLATGAEAWVLVSNDTSDCVNGWMTTNVTVTVDNELFNFSPSCRFSYTNTFVTASGDTCQINAGMCSPFFPRNRFEVYCQTGGFGAINILCPPQVH